MTSDPNANRPRGFENVGKTLDSKFSEVSKKLGEETERLVTYMNDEVVPALRTGSSKVLREAAERLQKAAEYIEEARRKSPPDPPRQPGEGNPSPS